MIAPNNSFKPNLLRYTNNMAEKACHVVASATQVGLTQVLCGRKARFCKCLLGWFVASATSSVPGAQLRRTRCASAATRIQWPPGRVAPWPGRSGRKDRVMGKGLYVRV